MKSTKPKRRWRSLGELEGSAEFEQFVQREFPVAASEFPDGISRRRWLQLMGASFALASVAGCRWETERLAAFAVRPEDRIPGEPQKFATSIELAGGVRHLLVTSYDGRPIKVEGNPDHPETRGGTDVYAQSSILDLYDPDRSGDVRQRLGRETFIRDWDEFKAWSGDTFAALAVTRGRGLALLTEPTCSPSFHAMLRRFRECYPEARVFQHASLGRDNERRGSVAALGDVYRTQLDLAKARVILCLDDDLIGRHPNALRYARDYAAKRDPAGVWTNRLYCIESQFSITGAAADHRLPMQSSQVGRFLSRLEEAVDRASAGAVTNALENGESDSSETRVLRALADDLCKHLGASVIAAGSGQPPEVHARIHRLNARLGNIGRTVLYTSDPALDDDAGDLTALTREMQAGAIETLVILGGNPVYDAPADVAFGASLGSVRHTVRLGIKEDETSARCQWHLPQTHAFEQWGDVRSFDGTLAVSQPLIEPLLDGKSGVQLLAMLIDDPRDAMQIVRDSISETSGQVLTDKQWRRLVHDGFLSGTKLRIKSPEVRPLKVASDFQQAAEEESQSGGRLELVFTASDTTFDGRFANNGWLQETPDSLTKLTWDNAAIISPRTARELGIEHATLIELQVAKKSIRVPAFILPGQADGSIGLAIGYGRTAAGHVGGDISAGVAPIGANANQVRISASPYIATNLRVSPTGESYKLATTQEHHAIDSLGFEEIGRRVGELVREGTVDEYRQHADFAQHEGHHAPLKPLWEEPSYDGHAWGMSIDLNKCIGCNACMVACQSENNVPIVGKEQVSLGREMHWLRTDRYFSGDIDNPQVATQPVACHHCENAPCEQVCPVAATVHSDEGLNDMVYNRCIGTRYCANNCPYKVRRFNFFDYSEQFTEPGRELVQLSVNPSVTVRSRGVMEKCTYCVQRIQSVKIGAKNERRPIRDGELTTACQQACPTDAIEFGDLNQTDSRVAKAHADPRAYGMLAELNVKPRTKYLARIRNPHPWLHASETHEELPQEHGHS